LQISKDIDKILER